MNTTRKIITIGREYGSGGREIGKLVAEKLGVPFYDKEILTRAAADSGLAHELFEKNDEKANMSTLLSASPSVGMSMSRAPMGLQMPLNQRVFLAQFDAINKLAAEGPCVIVGRCADYVLKDFSNVVHVFIYATVEKRIERIMRIENASEAEAKELVRKTDRQRRSYYNFFADGNWGLRSNYDLMIRTDNRNAGEIAESIIAFANIGK
ncbi:MAG: cytidylate kinase-like family protein [Clostridiales bacterium]|nr:cytidylate kinase-like family protein [Clostridiales bacterium]